MPIEALDDPKAFEVATREVFGPFQVVVEYGDSEQDNIDVVLGSFGSTCIFCGNSSMFSR